MSEERRLTKLYAQLEDIEGLFKTTHDTRERVKLFNSAMSIEHEIAKIKDTPNNVTKA
jgi:hypothetical protein